MSRNRQLEGFVLKRQDYAEADYIVTFFSLEEGKVRALVKSAKLTTSKLQSALQPIFLVKVALTGLAGVARGLPKLIEAQAIEVYSQIIVSEYKLMAWYSALEFCLRALPDSQPNQELFQLLKKLANQLNSSNTDSWSIKCTILQFQIQALVTLGLGIKTLPHDSQQIFFDFDQGGFTTDRTSTAIEVSVELYQFFGQLLHSPFDHTFEFVQDTAILEGLLNRFVTYQLDREIKSYRYLTNH